MRCCRLGYVQPSNPLRPRWVGLAVKLRDPYSVMMSWVCKLQRLPAPWCQLIPSMRHLAMIFKLTSVPHWTTYLLCQHQSWMAHNTMNISVRSTSIASVSFLPGQDRLKGFPGISKPSGWFTIPPNFNINGLYIGNIWEMLHELFPECKLVYLVSLYKPHVAHLHPPSHSKPETTIPQKIKMTSRHPNLF